MTNLSVTHTAAYGVQAYNLALARPQGQRESALWQQTSSSPTSEQSEDQVTLSKKGRELSTSQEAVGVSTQEDKKPADTKLQETKGSDQLTLDKAELRQIQQLQQRDAEVRTHEQAHLSVAGQYASGGPSFSYQTGPNGKRYAVGSSVRFITKDHGTICSHTHNDECGVQGHGRACLTQPCS